MANHLSLWLISALFWIGAALVPLGLFMLLAPARATQMGEFLNRWISTQSFFDSLNRPRYQEKLFYRHHRALGTILILLSSTSLYMLVFYEGVGPTARYFQRLAVSDFESWLFPSLYYVLIVVITLALVIGCIVLIRPSALKRLEAWSNRWITTEEHLSTLDEMHELPVNLFSGRPRIFGIFVLAGALYIMYMTRNALM